jgi:predicted RNA-binding Zn ribbon-like protein
LMEESALEAGMTAAARPEQHALVGGRACLDFANTLAPRHPEPGAELRDYTPTYQDLVAWAARARLLTPAQRHRLTAAAGADPEGAAAVLQDARRLREATYQAFSAIAQGLPAPPDALGAIQDAYLAALQTAQLGPVPAGLDWRWPKEDDRLERVVWPLARSAVDLAVSGQLARVKRCPGDDGQCGWLFLDTSKNATRRWCSMRTCGSRVKSRRQAARLRAARVSR